MRKGTEGIGGRREGRLERLRGEENKGEWARKKEGGRQEARAEDGVGAGLFTQQRHIHLLDPLHLG